MAGAIERKVAFGLINEAHEIARRLYLRDKARYEQIFGWIGEQIKKRRSLELIVKALKRIEEMEVRGAPPQGPIDYLGGMLRRLEEEWDAKRLRKGDPMVIGDIPLNIRRLGGKG
jgi:hypothetical protein